LEECGPCPVFARYTLAFALQLREKHGRISVRVAIKNVRERRVGNYQSKLRNIPEERRSTLHGCGSPDVTHIDTYTCTKRPDDMI
jgi:hypothetical protein